MFALFVQKDTLEDGKVKAVLKSCNSSVEETLTALQEENCYEFQLIAYVTYPLNNELDLKLAKLTAPYKTNYGKNWYSFDAEAIGDILSLFFEYTVATVNLPLISSIFGFSFTMFPVVTKEINIVRVSRPCKNNMQKVSASCEVLPSTLQTSLLPSSTNEDSTMTSKYDEKEDIISLIEQIEEKSDIKSDTKLEHKRERSDKSHKLRSEKNQDKNDKNDKQDKNEKQDKTSRKPKKPL